MSGECYECGEHCLECSCKKDINQALHVEFPDLYKDVFIDCGPGWYNLLRELSLRIKDHLLNFDQEGKLDNDYVFHVHQVKGKYGVLRYYVKGCCMEMHKLIYFFEGISSYTCETCGAPSQIRRLGERYYNICNSCYEKMGNQ